MKRIAVALTTLSLTLAVGCGGGGGEESKTSGQAAQSTDKPAPSAAATTVDAATAATVTGNIAFSGTAPEMRAIDVSSELTCHSSAETHPVFTENVIVNGNGTLRNVFVYVKQGLEGMTFPTPSEPVVLDQLGCRYLPHVTGVQVDQPLLVKNSDEGVLHNIHTFSKKGNAFNFGMPKVMESTKSMKKAEVMVRVKCDVHSWMSSYIGVLNHPYFGVTGDDGAFSLAPLPPGEYVIEAWHEEYGSQTQTITVGEKESKEVTFTFKPAS